MADEQNSQLFRAGGNLRILASGAEPLNALIERPGARFLWTKDISAEVARANMLGQILYAQYGDGSDNFVFKVRIIGNEELDGKSLTKLFIVSQPQANDQRQAFRFQQLFDVEILRTNTRKKHEDEEDEEEEWMKCQGIDLSDTGVGFVGRKSFHYGEMLQCRFDLNGEVYTTRVKVVRIFDQAMDAKHRMYRIGAQFVELNEHIQRRIRRYIYNQQVSKRRFKKEK